MAADHRTVEVIQTMTLSELSRLCDADETWVVDMVSYGVLEPDGPSRNEWRFRGINIMRAKKAKRLQRDLGINTPGIALVLDLLEERDALLRKMDRFGAG